MNQATCKTCGASGPPWHHKPSWMDPEGIGDPGHRMNQDTPIPASVREEMEFIFDTLVEKARLHYDGGLPDMDKAYDDARVALLGIMERFALEIIGPDASEPDGVIPQEESQNALRAEQRARLAEKIKEVRGE